MDVLQEYRLEVRTAGGQNGLVGLRITKRNAKQTGCSVSRIDFNART